MEAWRAEITAAPHTTFTARIGGGRVVEFNRRTTPAGASVCTVADVTGVHNSAAALERDSTIIRHLSDAVAVTDLRCTILYHNPAFADIFAAPPKQCVGQCLPPAGLSDAPVSEDTFFADLNEAITDRGRHVFDVDIPLNTGRTLLTRCVMVPRKDSSGDHVGYIAVYRDMTEQADTRRRLERQDHVISQLSEGVIITDQEGFAIDCNGAAEDMFGYPRHELLGVQTIPLLYDEGQSGSVRIVEIVAALEAGRRWAGELHYRTKGGESRLSESNIQPFVDDRGRHVGYIGVHRDITGRRRAEDALRRQALVMEHLSEAVLVTDLNGRIEEYNESAARLLGVRRNHRAPDWVTGKLREIARNVERCGGFETMYDFTDDERGEIFVDSVAVPLSTRSGVLRIVSVHRDITERVRHQREEERLKQQIKKWKRLDTLGRMAGGIAHDFNNILTPIIGYAHLARRGVEAGSRVHEDLSRVVDGMENARELVQQILTFGQRVDPPRRPLLLDQTLRNALEIIGDGLPETVTLSADFGCDRVAVNANSTQLHQLMLNLVTNAVQAVNGKGGIAIRTDGGGEPSPPLRAENKMPEGAHVRLTVEDDGCGISAKDLECIFDPFFSTKPKTHGTGLGLSVVHGVVRSHRGVIQVFSTPGEGTRFEIFLPQFEGAAAIEAEQAQAAPPPGHGERILVVDDDADVRTMIARMLGDAGYDAECAEDGAAALERIRSARKGRGYDLILTDRSMPNLDGERLAQTLRDAYPRLPVLLMSGMIDARLIREHRHWGVTALLHKPILPRELNRAVRDCLD